MNNFFVCLTKFKKLFKLFNQITDNNSAGCSNDIKTEPEEDCTPPKKVLFIQYYILFVQRFFYFVFLTFQLFSMHFLYGKYKVNENHQ